jgi:hypothetical protein
MVMARRRRRAPRLLDVLESVSLGPKRALVVARLGDELFVLGSSEGGISLLSTRPAAGVVDESARSAAAGRAAPGGLSSPGGGGAADELRQELRRAGGYPTARSESIAPSGGPPPQVHDSLGTAACDSTPGLKGKVLDLFSRLRARARPPAPPRFDALLTESLEDVELRRKLAAGLSGRAGNPRPGSHS